MEALEDALALLHGDALAAVVVPDPAAGEAADDAELMVAIVRAAATGRPQSVAR